MHIQKGVFRQRRPTRINEMSVPINTKFWIPLIALFSLIAFFLQGREYDISKSHDQLQHSGKTAYRAPFKMRGITYRNSHKDRLLSIVNADEIRVQDRKFWAFNIKPFKEAVLENAKIRVYLQREETSGIPDKTGQGDLNFMPFAKDMLSIGKSFNAHSMTGGIVSRGAIKRLVLEIYNAGNPVMQIRARKAYVNFRKRLLKMIDVSMEDISSGRIIKSRFVKWNDNENVFEIEGTYLDESREGMSHGSMITIDLDFHISPLT
jgi:hypothetical protein